MRLRYPYGFVNVNMSEGCWHVIEKRVMAIRLSCYSNDRCVTDAADVVNVTVKTGFMYRSAIASTKLRIFKSLFLVCHNIILCLQTLHSILYISRDSKGSQTNPSSTGI